MARILLVDDNAPLRAAMALGLARGGHSIQTAEDGAAGLRALAAEVFDVMVTDLLMPERDGLSSSKRRMRCSRNCASSPSRAAAGSGPMRTCRLPRSSARVACS